MRSATTFLTLAATIPDDAFLNAVEVFGVRHGRKIWRDGTGRHVRYYPWYALHGEVEVFNGRGKHLGAVDPATRRLVKDPREGRTIEL